MDCQAIASPENFVGLETSQSTVSQVGVDQVEEDYYEAMSHYGHNSAEVLVSHHFFTLKSLRGRRLAAAKIQHPGAVLSAYHRRSGKSTR